MSSPSSRPPNPFQSMRNVLEEHLELDVALSGSALPSPNEPVQDRPPLERDAARDRVSCQPRRPDAGPPSIGAMPPLRPARAIGVAATLVVGLVMVKVGHLAFPEGPRALKGPASAGHVRLEVAAQAADPSVASARAPVVGREPLARPVVLEQPGARDSCSPAASALGLCDAGAAPSGVVPEPTTGASRPEATK
jgi:hypothetical protein